MYHLNHEWRVTNQYLLASSKLIVFIRNISEKLLFRNHLNSYEIADFARFLLAIHRILLTDSVIFFDLFFDRFSYLKYSFHSKFFI